MQMVATLGARTMSEEIVEKLTMKHSMSGSSRVSAMMGTDIQSDVLMSEIVSNPLWAT